RPLFPCPKTLAHALWHRHSCPCRPSVATFLFSAPLSGVGRRSYPPNLDLPLFKHPTARALRNLASVDSGISEKPLDLAETRVPFGTGALRVGKPYLFPFIAYCHSHPVGQPLHIQMPPPRPVNLRKKNPLPAPQRQLPRLHKHKLRRPHQHRFHVRIRIPLRVPVRSRRRHQPVQRSLGISRPRPRLPSPATSGSACSLIRIPAVVCGTYRKHVPAFTPSAVTTRCTSSVTSTICVRRFVRTRIACMPALQPLSGHP